MRYARKATRDRAVVLVMVIGILAALAVAATAFALFMNEANMAAANSAHVAQAELAARSGLEHAIRVIEASLAAYSFVSPGGAMDADGAPYEDPNDPRSGWYRYFEGDELVSKLGDAHEIRGKRFEFAWPSSVKRAEYVIFVRDLDGLLHANLARWNEAPSQSGDPAALVQTVAEGCAGLADGSALAAESALTSFSSLGELARRTFAGPPPGLREKYALQEWFTAYPVGAGTRPAVNVNTAPETLIAKILEPALVRVDDDEDDVLSRTKAAALAKYLCAWRPFRGRHDFEDVVRRVSGDDAVDALPNMPDTDPDNPYDNHLTERQFNDVLNNAAGELEADESAYDDLGEPGVYSFDGWAPFGQSGEGPYQTRGDCSAPDGQKADLNNPSQNVTWSVEFKFTSRFFLIYVLGRAWSPEAGLAVATRRCQAVYDAESNKVSWFRWVISIKGNIADF